MTAQHRSLLLRYGSAVVSVALAMFLCGFLDPILHLNLYYLWLVLALLFTGYVGGARPCMLAFVLSFLSVSYFILPPRFSFAVADPINHVGLFLYSLVSLAIIAFSSATMRGIRRIARSDTLLLEDMPAKLAAIENQLELHIAEGQKRERLLVIQYKVTAILTKAANLTEAAKPILQTIGEAFDWQVGLFWAVDRAAEVLRCLETWNNLGSQASPLEQISRQLTYGKGIGLLGRVWDTERLVCVPNMSTDAGLSRSSVAATSGLRGAIAFPIKNGVEFLGVMEFVSRAVTHPEDDVAQMMAALGGQISQFIERRAAENRLQQQEQERRTAHAIQQGLLPKRLPALPGFRISGKSVPASDVGGDCFDFISLGDDGGGGLAIVLADASGHGIGPALIVAETHAYLHALTTTCNDIGKILTLTNQRLASEVLDDRFVTLFLGRLEPDSKSLVYSSAGHCPGYVLDANGEIRTVLSSLGMPLGIDRAKTYRASSPIALQSDDLLLLYSDGILDAKSPTGAPFGVERMLDLVRVHRREGPEDILDALFQAIADFCRGCQGPDDMTAVLLHVETSLALP